MTDVGRKMNAKRKDPETDSIKILTTTRYTKLKKYKTLTPE